ncbi:DNRLRE domain-containing protein [Flagellimonas olearia]|uniref:DNRLRE domain-containing protein n=1 Tax=Flagellimonas olearia TaxID=552546 RepID=A0A6I1DZM9_9FLAO|nr:DNRLRE domain-containing protein [Allomuricauda olearia]KAB7528792.1 DNRLRE domain-containing protein [Allomuricauda olearia]
MKSIKVLGMALLGMSIILASCSAEDGEKGDQGLQGAKGDTGDKGDQGEQGLPGEDKPNVDFYFQNGFSDYTDTQDASIVPPNIGSDDQELQLLYSNNGLVTTERRSVLRFDNIADEITATLVGDGENCADAFRVNKATLYVYLTGYTNQDYDNLFMKIGFYGEDEPTFEQTEATWTFAHENEYWAADGGEAATWAGFSGSDDYTFLLPKGSGEAYGWFPIMLPRSVVENWICNTGSNKGMRLRIDPNSVDLGQGSIDIASSENPNTDLRPLLVIETEDVEPSAVTKMAPSSKTQDWDNMSYEEKMAPLYRYFAAKGL